MLAGGEAVLVAVSGGADSVALLLTLHRLAPTWRLTLQVAHVDHGLRPDSVRDAEFVVALGARLGLPVHVRRVDVAAGESPEAAARMARYRALEALADEIGADRIAVGHTADDQAETVLMRVLEGAGIAGLAGIPPGRGRIIRPLIAERRTALREWLAVLGEGWREDPTNADRRFFRNRLRHDVLPMLAERTGGDVVGALGRVAALAREAAVALDDAAAHELTLLVRERDGGLELPRAALAALPAELGARVLRAAAVRLGVRAPLRAWAQRGLRRILAEPPPRRPLALRGVRIEVSSGQVRVSRGAWPSLPERPVPVPGTVVLPEAGVALEAAIVPGEGYAVPRGPFRVAFDADRLERPLVVRGRRRGDRLPLLEGGERRVKSLLIAAKRPRWERGRVPLVQAGPDLVWVAGLRRGGAAPVTAATRRVLELRVRPLAGRGGAAGEGGAAPPLAEGGQER